MGIRLLYLNPRSLEPPPVTVIIVAHNSGDDLSLCLESLKTQQCALDFIVIYNASIDGSVQVAQATHPDIRLVSDGANDGFAGGANRGAGLANTGALLFLNPDVVLEQGCVRALFSALSAQHGSTICAPVIADANGRDEYGLTIDLMGDPIGLAAPSAPLFLNGCAFMTTRSAFEELGGFDAKFFMFCEDLDLCWRALLRGYDLLVVADAKVHHRGGGSTPGGYVTDGRIEVTSFRIALRERNTLAAIIRCAPVGWLIMIVPLRLVRMACIGVYAIAVRRFNLAESLVQAVAWNVGHFGELWRQRREMQVSPRTTRRQTLRTRIRREFVSAHILLQHGLPRFVDGTHG